ncbi:hypothetical protein [Longitalea luteola]|uniref:hypothetical protein n=1 Tax=Longitalea luteola TaxID=2812563 RepID=UPI001A96F405|nr:hypothetical protein [Longitalea luteola]
MTFAAQKRSVAIQQTILQKKRIRSQVLPCFSKIPLATKPFFKQWHIHIVDVTKIMAINHAEARQLLQELRQFYSKNKRDLITVEEFCAFTGIGKSYVRMHLVSRAMEHDLRRHCELVAVSW